MAFPGLRGDGSSSPRDVARVVNTILQGGLNCVLEVAVPDGAASVIVEDSRIAAASVLLVRPGSSVTAATVTGDVTATIAVVPGPERIERVVVLG